MSSNTYETFEHYRYVTHDWIGLAAREGIGPTVHELMRTYGWDFATAAEYAYEAKYGQPTGVLSNVGRPARKPIYLADIPMKWMVKDALLNTRHTARQALTVGVGKVTSTYWRVLTTIFLD